ncbi:MAG: hypothetical protein EON47_17390 [Acetobacteraceae bacterium]|nr:MAG: hypothetical protein EON47_17390 [Acetobacteraceae bacterium]
MVWRYSISRGGGGGPLRRVRGTPAMPRAVLSLLFFALLAFPLLTFPAAAQLDGAPKAPAVAAPPSQCPDNMDAFADSSEVLTCVCPVAQLGSGSVWGTDTYTADSATCRAALHAGMVGRQGGTVTLEMLPGATRYPACSAARQVALSAV